MELTLPIKKIKEINETALLEYLKKKGFDIITKPILRIEKMNLMTGNIDKIIFKQDDTPGIGGDNIECEYLESLRGKILGD